MKHTDCVIEMPFYGISAHCHTHDTKTNMSRNRSKVWFGVVVSPRQTPVYRGKTLNAFCILSRQMEGIRGWIPLNVEPSQTELLPSWHGGELGCFIIEVLTITPRQGSLSASLAAVLMHSSFSPILFLPSPRSHFPPLFLSGVRCLVPPMGCSTDAGWRHSGLILLLLMLMLKEAIGTCYFCCYPSSLGPTKRY